MYPDEYKSYKNYTQTKCLLYMPKNIISSKCSQKTTHTLQHTHIHTERWDISNPESS